MLTSNGARRFSQNYSAACFSYAPTMPSEWCQERYLAAYHFAAHAHGDQPYPGTDVSYIMHLSFVSMEVIATLERESGFDGDLAVQCALLHDTLEDTKTTFEELVETFGKAVANGVAALTKTNGLPKPDAMRASLRRIQELPREVWLVKLADRVTNLQPPPPDWDEEKIDRYRAQAHEILTSLGEASPYLAARLASKIAAYPNKPTQ
jgi:(p)ppGpp synthase/HD superfamily hydrolase